jgi:hypothetical protein
VSTITRKRTGVVIEDDRARIMPVDHVVDAREEKVVYWIASKAHI